MRVPPRCVKPERVPRDRGLAPGRRSRRPQPRGGRYRWRRAHGSTAGPPGRWRRPRLCARCNREGECAGSLGGVGALWYPRGMGTPDAPTDNQTPLPPNFGGGLTSPLQPPMLPPLKATYVETMNGVSVIAESLLALSVTLFCFVIVALSLWSIFSDDTRNCLLVCLKAVHENWRVALIFLFPLARLSWLRIEPRIREWGPAKLAAAPDPTKIGHTSLAAAEKAVP